MIDKKTHGIGFCYIMAQFIVGLAVAGQAAEPVRLNGAAAIAAALNPLKSKLEAAAGVPVAILSKNAGKGLQDLGAATCDIAMVTGSLEKAAAGANAERAGCVDVNTLKTTPVGRDRILFVVHPSNPVKELKLEQIKGIYTGAIKNWKEVGGTDAAIKSFTLGPRNGPRIALDEQLFQGAALASQVVLRENPREICPIVSQMPQGLGYLGESNLGPGTKTLQTDKELAMPFLMVTKGEPTPVQAKVIEAVKTLLAANK